MATGILYEGDGFLRSGPATLARPIAVKAATIVGNSETISSKVGATRDAESIEIEQREHALRRQYLPEWVCRVLES